VHDKQVRRRRAVLGLLVGVSLILLTAYFGESSSSPLHTVQRGIVEVFSPVQEGASTALKPVRDVAGWFSDTLNSKSRADRLQRQVDSLTAQLAHAQSAVLQNRQLTKLVGLDNSLGIAAYHQVAAHVIQRDPTLWYATIEVDKGSDDGVHVDDPVIGDSGLVGKISTVDPSVSIVTLITDHSMAVAAQIQDAGGDTGVLVPAVGDPDQLLVQQLPQTGPFHEAVGQQVVTAGFKAGPLQSLYPPGIPIGTISSASENDLLNDGEVQVDPNVDLRHLDAVQILTKPHGGTERAQLP
jgi:rod shape-determining protein MreC